MFKDRIKGIIIGIVLVAGLNFANATWSNPTLAPTGGNPEPPVNVGSILQQKSGGLQANYLVSNTGIGIGYAPPTTGLNVDGKVGIGTESPSDLLHLQADGAADIKQTRANASASGNHIISEKARGTTASPTPVVSGDDLQLIRAYGWGGAAGFMEAARIHFDTEGTIANSRVPGVIKFFTATNAQPSVLTNRMTIDSDGNVGIGTASPSQKLDVVGQIHASADICTDAGGGICLSTVSGGGTDIPNCPLGQVLRGVPGGVPTCVDGGVTDVTAGPGISVKQTTIGAVTIATVTNTMPIPSCPNGGVVSGNGTSLYCAASTGFINGGLPCGTQPHLNIYKVGTANPCENVFYQCQNGTPVQLFGETTCSN